MKTVDLVYFNAGGGHRAAAIALEAAIRSQGLDWQVRLVNLFDVLDPQDMFRKTTGMKPEQYYNGRLARGWTIGLAQELRVLQAVIRLSHKQLVSRLRRHWARSKPDMVVSLLPNFNRAMCQAAAMAQPLAPYVTILTDFADLPPHFWIEPRQSQHYICGTPHAVRQALSAGCNPELVHATSGMIIHPDHYADLALDRRAELRKINFDPDRPVGIVMFGGHGSRVMRRIARRLDDVQLILICGHNAALAEDLREMRASAPRLILGFTTQVRTYMRLGDFFIGKPGPGSISEAVQQRLPVIVVRNAWTMPQERYNAEWILENDTGVVLDSYKAIRTGVGEVIEHIDHYRVGVNRIRNEAVFEIPKILDRILMTPVRVGVNVVQHFRSAERLHLV
jgi:UDP-N-acetylglucosamine:LPS N-acetylglucosamine transferase